MAVDPARTGEQSSPACILNFCYRIATLIRDHADDAAVCVWLLSNIKVGINLVDTRLIFSTFWLFGRCRTTDQALKPLPIPSLDDLARAVLATDIVVAVYATCRNTSLPHDLFDDRYRVLKRFFVIISRLHAHLNADAATVAVASKQVITAVINPDVPTPTAVRCRLIGGVTIIHVIMGGHILKIAVILRSCVCQRVCSGGEVIRVVDYDTFRIVLTVSIRVTD